MPVSPWTLKLLEVIEEEGPLRADDVIIRISPLIPPALAIRKNETQRRYNWRKSRKEGRPTKREKNERVQLKETDALLRHGARVILNQVIWDQMKRGRLVVFTHEEERWLRLPSQKPPKAKRGRARARAG